MTRLYTKDHEWLDPEDGNFVVGITDHAQSQLGDIVFVDLPQVGQSVTQGGSIAVVESVKAASEIYAPISGEIVAVNQDLPGNPSALNEAAESKAWIFKIRPSNTSELTGLLDEATYKKLII